MNQTDFNPEPRGGPRVMTGQLGRIARQGGSGRLDFWRNPQRANCAFSANVFHDFVSQGPEDLTKRSPVSRMHHVVLMVRPGCSPQGLKGGQYGRVI